MYSFSTCWNSARHTDGRAMLREIRELGFEYAELSHGIRISLMPGILEAVQAGEMKISTLHNFCPLPVGVTGPSPNLYEFSSDRDRDRQLALKHTLGTFDFAKRVGAPLVVLHFGSMDLKDYTGKLKELLERGEKGTPKFQKVVEEASAAREAKKKKFYDRSKDMLRELVGEAKFRGLKLGIEIREAVEELPVESDFVSLLKEFPAPVYYWHDTGHAQIKEDLGFINHVQHLASLADRLAGFHLHDVKAPARDHFPTGGGHIDFAALKPYVKPEHIKVFELSPKVPLESVHRGIAHLKKIWGDA
ncbi:MAG TPA: sugar phosphate isomerase/epimerase [Candidatus Acidoferrales bacterium]|jgi:sugar phosphate isomerase/epimerase|nr:sugar phosphate isomerase/epimerase [Candidatus Acidoferrales bacterium]